MKEFDNAFQSMFRTNLGVREGERVLIFGDVVRSGDVMSAVERQRRARLREVAQAAARFAARTWGHGSYVEYVATTGSGIEPPEALWCATFGQLAIAELKSAGLFEKILTKAVTDCELVLAEQLLFSHGNVVPDVIVAMSNNSTSHTRYRTLACRAGARFASLPRFDPDMFFSCMAVDWHALAGRTVRVATALRDAEWVHVTAPNGTNMHVCKRGRAVSVDDGLLTAPGSCGNLPAGEAYFAPLEGESSGTLVLEWGPSGRLGTALHLTIENGVVVRIRGDDPHRHELEQKFHEHVNCRNLAELGIGTNDKATRPDNVLEAEKILGTIHFALGDNTAFGGATAAPYHLDYLVYRPAIVAVAGSLQKPVLVDPPQRKDHIHVE